ncbi:MAG: hypothetical protein ACLFN1_03355 [Bacteroidales bacterium]
MRKYIMSLIIMVIALPGSHAQLQKHGFNISAGVFSSNFFDAVNTDILGDQQINGMISKNIETQTGAIFITYNYFPSGKLSLGWTAGLERLTGDIQVDASSTGLYYNDYYTGAFEIDYRYVLKRRFQVYSGGALGVTFKNERNEMPSYTGSEQGILLAYQLNAVGIRFGGIAGIFAEAGFGYKGFIKFGLNLQL